jgi:hypothetical protein
MRLDDVKVADVRVNGEGQGELIRVKPVVNQYMRNKVPGYVSNVNFRNLSVSGKPGPYRVQISGADEKHDVRGVTFENVQILGSKLGEGAEQLEVGQHVRDLQFKAEGQGKPKISPP